MYYTGQNVVYGVTEREMSAIYGAEHLLRMIVSLPGMVSQSTLDPDSVSIVRDYVNELLQCVVPLPLPYLEFVTDHALDICGWNGKHSSSKNTSNQGRGTQM